MISCLVVFTGYFKPCLLVCVSLNISAVGIILISMSTLKPVQVQYLVQVKEAFGLDSVKHSNASVDFSLIFTSMGETADDKERNGAVIHVAEKI